MRSNRRYRAGALAIVFFMVSSGLSRASTGHDEFPSTFALGETTLMLKGMGSAYYAGLVHVYDAALYAPTHSDSEQLLAGEIPKCLRIHYRVSLDRDKFVLAANKVLRRQRTDLDQLGERIERLHTTYRDVAPGDRYDLCFAPDTGTRLLLNGRLLTEIEGSDFAQAYFGIWLGERPISTRLRDDLLEPALTGRHDEPGL